MERAGRQRVKGHNGVVMNLVSPEACMCSSIRKAARAVTQRYDNALRPSGLRSTQFNILATIHEHKDANLALLGKELVLDQTTLTRSLDLLEHQGLVERTPAASLRYRSMRLTASGRRKFDRALPLWRTAQANLLSGLGTGRWTALLAELEGITAAAQSSQA
jgi:DNA-binding MarR family transcriptional regulator